MRIIKSISNTITRPSDTAPYTSGDLVANSTTNTLVTPFTFAIPEGKGLKLWRAQIDRSNAAVANASFRLHLYKDSPTCTNGDNGAWLTTRSGYINFIDIVGTSPTFSDTSSASGVWVNNSVFAPLMVVSDVDQIVYGLLEARAAYTPASAETFVVTLTGEAYV